MSRASKILESLSKKTKRFSEASIPRDIESKLKDELYKVFQAGAKSSIEVTNFYKPGDNIDFIDATIKYPDGDIFGNDITITLALDFRNSRLRFNYWTKFNKGSVFSRLIASKSDSLERKFEAPENGLDGLGDAIKDALK